MASIQLLFGPSNGAIISVADSEALAGARHACHVALVAEAPFDLWGTAVQHTILMMMRFDGSLGFPGGFRDDESEALHMVAQRELTEELGLAMDIQSEHHLYTECISTARGPLCLHLFAKQISAAELAQIQIAALQASDKHEVLGIVRVPLYVLDNTKGLPQFLGNVFAGNSREQLLNVIAHYKVFNQKALKAIVDKL